MKKVVLVVMDGIGYSEKTEGNAVAVARTPNLDWLMENASYTYLKAHGEAVGLPSDEDMGNSEVGHNAMGCGQIYSQGAKLVNEKIESKEVFQSKAWNELVENCVKNNSYIHFIGLLSDGNVHSNISHLFSLLEQSKKEQIKGARVHILLDGRDVPATSALTYVDLLENKISKLRSNEFDCAIASGGGRMKITMDRYNANWNMVKLGYDLHVKGEGRGFTSATEAITTYRKEKVGIVDQDLPGFVIINDNNEPIGKIKDGDSVILFNFRGDRAIEISRALTEEVFCEFDRGVLPNIMFAGMLQYDGDKHIPERFLVEPPKIKNTLSEILVKNNIRQYAISETQKYGHVTYFWNGNKLDKFDDKLETFCEIPSDKVSFDERPWMKSAEITDEMIKVICSDEYDFIRCNYPNGDMVGHTGSFDATVIGVEAVDLAIGRLIQVIDEKGYCLLITADHGNADEMFEKNKKGELQPRTAHSLNKVPFIIYGIDAIVKKGEFGLSNIASTVTQILGIKPHSSWDESVIL